MEAAVEFEKCKQSHKKPHALTNGRYEVRSTCADYGRGRLHCTNPCPVLATPPLNFSVATAVVKVNNPDLVNRFLCSPFQHYNNVYPATLSPQLVHPGLNSPGTLTPIRNQSQNPFTIPSTPEGTLSQLPSRNIYIHHGDFREAHQGEEGPLQSPQALTQRQRKARGRICTFLLPELQCIAAG